MDREDALAGLLSPSQHVRRQAARVLASLSQPSDLATLQRAFRTESVSVVRINLRRAILRATSAVALDGDDEPMIIDHEASLRMTSQHIVHEVRQYLERISLHVSKLSQKDDNVSAITAELSRLNEFLKSLLTLGDLSARTETEEFELSIELKRHTSEEIMSNPYPIELAGPSPLLVIGDKRLIKVIFCNALRNAIEASVATDEENPIVINWGNTEADQWISIADTGVGMTAPVSKASEIGSTTKVNHLGMGLTLAQKSAEALSGTIDLTPREVGTLFEFRWPKANRPAVK